MKLTIMDRAQRYRDFGYAAKFKERHPIEQWFKIGRYPGSRIDAESRWVDRRWVEGSLIPRPCFSVPRSHMQPLLPRWANR